jgi:hypothetical protein
LIETTAAWSVIVRAILLDQQEALAALQDGRSTTATFLRRCTTDPDLRSQLDLLCSRQLHGLLMEYLVDGIKAQLHAHVAPHFWVRYCETTAALQQCRGQPSAALQRRCQRNLFSAVRELHTYMGTRLQLARVLETRLWADSSWTESAWTESPWDATLWEDRLWAGCSPRSEADVSHIPIDDS